jgi:hypothetical protein
VAAEETSENRIVPDAGFILENVETGRRGLFFNKRSPPQGAGYWPSGQLRRRKRRGMYPKGFKFRKPKLPKHYI